ncbi:MAG: hypothetical protein IPF51_08050 [Dehalococcoidia bacterium]|uniref:hypothetical protein n=1 Tax=Candidatus Amarobacter glycogenicus TaxID=3140699 RepID=UPI0031364866|nr:hypothetical protein [Dehalococcoidia bacterium]
MKDAWPLQLGSKASPHALHVSQPQLGDVRLAVLFRDHLGTAATPLDGSAPSDQEVAYREAMT